MLFVLHITYVVENRMKMLQIHLMHTFRIVYWLLNPIVRVCLSVEIHSNHSTSVDAHIVSSAFTLLPPEHIMDCDYHQTLKISLAMPSPSMFELCLILENQIKLYHCGICISKYCERYLYLTDAEN